MQGVGGGSVIAPLFLTDSAVNGLLNMEESISAVEESLNQLALGNSANRPRGHDIAGPGVYLAHMQASACHQVIFGFKTYTAASDSFRFFVYLYSTATGALQAVI